MNENTGQKDTQIGDEIPSSTQSKIAENCQIDWSLSTAQGKQPTEDDHKGQDSKDTEADLVWGSPPSGKAHLGKCECLQHWLEYWRLGS